MTDSRINPKVDEFLNSVQQWKEEYEKLRMIILECQLIEDMRWEKPCYSLQKENLVLIHGFKEYCALLFLKGALLKDSNGILVRQTENVPEGRQIRFTNLQEIEALEPVIKDYIYEAIEIEKAQALQNANV